MLNSLSIRYKIGLIAVIGLVGFLIFQTASYRLSISLRDQMQRMISEDFALLQFSNEVQISFTELDKLYQAALTEADMDTLLEADAKATQMKLRFESMKTRYNINDPYFVKLIEFFTAYVNRASAHTATVISEQLDYEKTFTGYSEVTLLRERYQEIEKQFLSERYRLFEARLKSIERQETEFVQVGLVLGVVLSILLVLFSSLIIKRLISAFSNAVNVAEQIAMGNLDQNIQTLEQDETGQLITSLIVMRDALKKQKEENIHREKVQTFFAGLNEVMRGDKGPEELAQVVLNYLVTELHAQVGIFYVLDGDMLSILASHAYPEDEFRHRQFRLGETIVGQAAVQQRVQIINDIPDNYVQVGSAIGRAVPRSILLFPVIFEDQLKGVIEVGAFRRFVDDDIILINRCNDAVAVSFNSAQSRVKVANMLQQTQEQAEELKKQRQELAQFNRQLEEKTFYLDSQRSEILEKNKELERSGRELVEKSRALELSGRYKSQFLSTMSHELRTPLNSILILSEALIENRHRHLDEREVQHARVINTAGADLLTLINDILDLSKVEEGKMDIIIDEIAMVDLASSLAQQFEYVARDKGLEYVVNLADDAPAVFYTDRHRLKQIIKNFISNSLKFTEKGGIYLDIMPPDAAFKARYPQLAGHALLFRVRDTGVGIDKTKQAIIFEAFKQADGTTSRKYGGTGLGLSISLALAKLLGGDIVLESAGEGAGASFTLVLPMASPVAVPAAGLHNNGKLVDSSLPQAANIAAGAGYHLREELLLFINDKKQANRIIDDCKNMNIDCYWENRATVLMDVLERDHFSFALIEPGLLGDDPSISLSRLLARVDNAYVIGEAGQWPECARPGCHVVSELDSATIAMLIDNIVDYQQTHASKVLVIEDNPVFQEVLRAVFSSRQLHVTIAVDGRQALECLGRDSFDCLIVDLNLPDYKGLDLLRAIRANAHYTRQPIIVFTAEDLSLERQQEIKQYAAQILLKTPKAIVSLYENVRQLVFASKHQAGVAGVPVVKTYQPGMLSDKTLLLVDDDARNIYSISAMLEAEGVNIHSARSGREALDLLASETGIDMVLLDIMMPEMDGYEVLHRMRQDARLKSLPVIAVTAKAMVGDREKCLDAGATDYLSKPVEKSGLLNCIVTHLF